MALRKAEEGVLRLEQNLPMCDSGDGQGHSDVDEE